MQTPGTPGVVPDLQLLLLLVWSFFALCDTWLLTSPVRLYHLFMIMNAMFSPLHCRQIIQRNQKSYVWGKLSNPAVVKGKQGWSHVSTQSVSSVSDSSKGDFLIAIIYASSIRLQFILIYSCLLIHLNNACKLPYLQSKWRVGMWCLKHPVNSLRDDQSSTQALEPVHMLIKFLWLT